MRVSDLNDTTFKINAYIVELKMSWELKIYFVFYQNLYFIGSSNFIVYLFFVSKSKTLCDLLK